MLAAILVAGIGTAGATESGFGLGRPPSADEIAAWNIDVRGDGAGLPPGHGSVAEGQALFADKCAGCHGAKGQGGAAPALVGGIGTLKAKKPLRTVGSYWPYAPPVFDYIHRAMPFTAPQSLSADETYAVTAYILALNGLVPADAVMDRESLPKVAMPNRNGFVPDPRPDTGPTARAR
jgi:mono/diheme cytochrome c family protein